MSEFIVEVDVPLSRGILSPPNEYTDKNYIWRKTIATYPWLNNNYTINTDSFNKTYLHDNSSEWSSDIYLNVKSNIYPLNDSIKSKCGGPKMIDNNLFNVYINNTNSELGGNSVWNCFYDAELFANPDPLLTFDFLQEYKLNVMECQSLIEPSCRTGPTYYYVTKILPAVCSKTTNTACPASVGKTCSQFLSNDLLGNECRLWAETYPEYADVIKKDYCLNLPHAKECQCILRTSDPEYNHAKISYPDACWFIPCTPASENTYLQLQSDKLVLDKNECGSACQQIFDLYGSGQIKASFISKIDCNFSSSSTNKEIKEPQTNTYPYNYMLIGIIVFLFFVFIGSLLFYIYK